MATFTHLLLRQRVVDDLATLALRPAWAARLNGGSVRVAVLLVVIAILNFVDLSYTLLAHRVRMLGEMNPIAARILSLNGEQSLICYKLLTLVVGSALLWKLRRNKWVPRACWLLIIVYVWLSAVWLVWARDYSQMADAETAAYQVMYAHARGHTTSLAGR